MKNKEEQNRKVIYVPIVDKHGNALMPCKSTRVRRLRKKHKTRIFSMAPYTIQIMDLEKKDCILQETEVKIDPGSKTSALAACVKGAKRGWFVVWAVEIEHKSLKVRNNLAHRRSIRLGRRSRKTRYRQPRFNNRVLHPRTAQGYTVWLPPSVVSCIENIVHMIQRWQKYFPVGRIIGELNKFDAQKIINPEIAGIEYQYGSLHGFEVREYILQKFKYTCVYCQKSSFKHNIRMEIDHVIPKSKGGSDAVSNLVLSCYECNQKKGNQCLDEYLKKKHAILKSIKEKLNTSLNLRDAAQMNVMRHELYRVLSGRTGLHAITFAASQIKFNRVKQSYPKNHWVDAICVGPTGEQINIKNINQIFIWKAIGRGSRQMCRMNKYGFPRTSPKTVKRFYYKGAYFQTGDEVVLNQTTGKYKGAHQGVVGIRANGRFDITTPKGKITGNVKDFSKIKNFNGYNITRCFVS